MLKALAPTLAGALLICASAASSLVTRAGRTETSPASAPAAAEALVAAARAPAAAEALAAAVRAPAAVEALAMVARTSTQGALLAPTLSREVPEKAAPAAADGAPGKAAPAPADGAPAANAAAPTDGAPAANAPAPGAVGAAPAPAAATAPETRARGTRIGGGRGVFYLPSDLTTREGTFDLVIHFHGANETVEPRFDRVGLNAVLYTLNLGIGSGKYEAMFPDGRALERVIAEVEATMKKRAPALAGARVGRVALSAWSAGYGAVARVLAYPGAAERVDAVLLADAPHTGFQAGTRQVSALGLAPYVSFGRRALAGEKLMVVTHSQIETPDYASTTRTAHALVEALGLPEGEPAAADDPKMVMYEREEAGSMHVFGFRGGDAPAHCQHLYNIGRHLWSRLGTRWGADAQPAPAGNPELVASAR
ncbi:MAG TPA: hypothetical protein VFS00_03695 [Polyangiaceae bacterium]|nr:hypothetical protein [Polyangiaceae bacterium]